MKMQIRNAAVLTALICALLSPRTAKSQSHADTTGTLNGRLTDWHSVPLVQAVVTVRNLATGATAQAITGKNGSYRFTGLGSGEYRLEADVPQLGRGAVEGILVSAGHATRVQAALVMEMPDQPGPVEAEIHELDPVAPAVTTMIDEEELASLPLPTRNWQEFAATTPATGSAAQGRTSAAGQLDDQTGTESNEESADDSLSLAAGAEVSGASSIDGIQGTPRFHGGTETQSSSSRYPGSSAVTSLEARTGNSPADGPGSTGGALNLVTGHGSNGLHGQIFYMNRQSLWGALNPFTQWIRETAQASGIYTAQFAADPYTPANSRQTFGVGVGSQLKRDKLYWFAAADGFLRNDPAVATVRHPTDFFARPSDDQLTMLAARLDLQGPQVLENAASAYSGWLEQFAGLLGPVPRSSHQIQGFGRIDWQTTDRNHIALEGQGASENSPAGALGRSSETFGSHSFGDSKSREAWAMAKWDSFLTANLLNVLAVQYGQHVLRDTPQAPSAFEQPLLANAWGQLPEIIDDSRYGFILGKPARLSKSSYPDERYIAAQDTLSWVRGAHLVKAGGSFDHVADAVGALVNQTGTYDYADALNFVSDAAAFLNYGIDGSGDPTSTYHRCDATERVYNRGGQGNLGGLGFLPCYAWYSQRIGPSNWNLSTNDLAAFATEQWQPLRNLTLSAGVRLEAEQLPAPIAGVANSDLSATQQLPPTSLNWGPRFGLAWSPWPSLSKGTVIRLGAGLYSGRIGNAAVLAALTQTGSPNSDQNFFFRPDDTGAPPFPAVFPVAPQTAITPGAVYFAPHFRAQQVDQAVFSLEQELPSHWLVTVSALASLGRRLPISVDTNLDRGLDANGNPRTITYTVVDPFAAGPIKTPQITAPLYTARLNASYQQLASIESRANSTYDAAMFKLVRYGSNGLSLHAHYLYAHATDWNPNESGQVAVNDVFNPLDFHLEYGASNLDIRHSAGATVLYRTPWKLHGWAGILTDAWSIAAIGQYRSGLPFTMRTGGYIPAYFVGSDKIVEGVGPGINGSGGDNRLYGIGRNTFRYPATYTADARLGKRFDFPHRRELELLAESFNLFNHQNVTQIETTGYVIYRGTPDGGPPTLNFLSGVDKYGVPNGKVEFGKPVDVNATSFYRQREIQLGLRARF